MLLWCSERRAELKGQREVVIITTNVCGTARLCGGEVLEVHGSIREERCCRCDEPACTCGPEFRGPAVRWHGDSLPLEMEARSALRGADTVLVVGTSDCCLSIWAWMADAHRERSLAGLPTTVYQVDPRPVRPPHAPPTSEWKGVGKGRG